MAANVSTIAVMPTTTPEPPQVAPQALTVVATDVPTDTATNTLIPNRTTMVTPSPPFSLPPFSTSSIQATLHAGIPEDFVLIDSAPGVQLFKKDYANGSPDFIQLVDLSQGARLSLLYGKVVEPRSQKGVYGGADPRMTSLDLQTYWQQSLLDQPTTFCMTNGAFFYMPEYPTRLAFPLKVNGEIVSDGWGIKTYPDQKLILELWQDRANIQELSQETLYDSNAKDILGGLSEEANKRSKYAVGRTFIGVDDRDGDGVYENVLILNTQTAQQSGAAAVLREFGAEKVIMLDGGGSTQLLCHSGWHTRSDRPIPQAIAVIAATPPPVSAILIEVPQWILQSEGEKLIVPLQLENTGVLTWSAETSQLIFQTAMSDSHGTTIKGIPLNIPAPGIIARGETGLFLATLPAVSLAGIIPLTASWQIIHQNVAYSDGTVRIKVINLPQTLTSKESELDATLQLWIRDDPAQVETLVMQWINLKMQPSPTPTQVVEIQSGIHIQDVLVIPAIMLPVLIILAIIVGKNRR